MQCCPRGSRQHCMKKKCYECCVNTLGTILHKLKLSAMLSERPQTTFHKKTFCAMLSWHSQDNMAQVKTLQCYRRCSRQHCIRNNSVQNCVNILGRTLYRKKHYAMLPQRLCCIKKSCARFYKYAEATIEQFKTLRSFVRDAPHNIASEKVLCNVALILLEQHCTG